MYTGEFTSYKELIFNSIRNTVKSSLEAAASNILGGQFTAATIQVRLQYEGGH